VRIREVNEAELRSLQDGHGGTLGGMLKLVGKSGKVVSVDNDGGVKVEVDGAMFTWSPHLLEVEDASLTCT
jgi:Mind bomb SH3 repeat domain